MKRALIMLGFCFLTVVLTVMTMLFIQNLAPVQSIGEVSYVDLISIVLTALSIMITILGLFVAVLGVIGWTTFEGKLRDHSFTYLTAELSKDGKLRKEFEAILTEMSLRGVRPNDHSTVKDDTDAAGSERPYND
jgi:hypothetical protein